MPSLDAFSKRAAIVSVVAITMLQLLLHPDATWMLRTAGGLALVLGWIAARTRRDAAHAAWLIAAPLAPAVLMALTRRQGEPLLDPIWMAGLAGFVVRTISWSRWSFPPFWSVLVGGWALMLSLAWPILVAREIGFDPALLGDLGAINSWAGLSAPHVVAWTLYVTLTQLLGVLWFDMICGLGPESGSPRAWRPRGVDGLWIGVTLASVVAIVQGTIDLGFLNTSFWVDQKRAGSSMLNPNAYGVAAAFAGPIGFVVLRASGPRAALAGLLVLAVNWAGLWLSASRTALICGLAGAAGLAVDAWRAREAASPRHMMLAASGAGALLAAVVLLGGAADPLERLSEVHLTRAGLASLRDRGTYGPIADQMIREYPLTGVGVGAFHYLAPDYERVARNDQLPFDNAQNWWRHQAAELGLLGGALILLWSALVGWQLVAGRARDAHAPGLWTVRALLAGLAITSLLGIPTQAPVVLLWFFVLVAWLRALTVDVLPVTSPRVHRAAWVAALLLGGVYAGSHALLATGPLSVDNRARRFHHEYVAGAYGHESPGQGAGFRWTDDESHFILPVQTPWLMLRLWAQHPDIAERPVHVAIRTSCGVAFERDLASAAPVSLLINVPSALDVVDMTVTASRTWSPADTGGTDSRRLGVAVSVDFQKRPATAEEADQRIEWRACPP